MAQFTLVTRLADGFLLMESNEPLHGSTTIKDQAKAIARRLEPHSPTRLSVDCGPHQISYLLEDGLCFLVVTDTAYPRRLTFSYLASVHREFTAYLRDVDGEGWKNALSVTSRAYAHQGFAGSKLPQLRREYADPQSKSNASRLSEELQDVHSIMRKNIAEVLQRGENLDHLSRVSSKLAADSKTFKWGAKKLNYLDALRKWAPCVGILAFIIIVLLWRAYF